MSDIGARPIFRRGFRADEYVLTARLKWDSGVRKPGILGPKTGTGPITSSSPETGTGPNGINLGHK